MRPALAVAVFLLYGAVLVSVFGARIRLARKLAWALAVVLLPVLGAAAWILRGRARTGNGGGPK